MADRLSAKDAFRVLSGNDPEQRETVIKSLWEIPGEGIAGLPIRHSSRCIRGFAQTCSSLNCLRQHLLTKEM